MDLDRAMECLLEQQAASQARFDAQIAQINQTLAETVEIGRRTREELRHAVRLAVQEGRTERKRRREADEKLAASDERLRSSQEELRKSLQTYLDSLRHPRNGHDKQ